MKIDVLDHGYVRLVEAWGHGDAGFNSYTMGDPVSDFEVGIIEAARQSTQGSFRGWESWSGWRCTICNCAWHDNGDGTLRLAYAWSTPCETCRNEDGNVSNPAMKPAGDGGDAKLLRYLYNHRHSTPFEFAGMVIEVRAPIFVFREWHRHRTQSYNEMSARYAPLPDMAYMPSVDRIETPPSAGNKQAGAVKGASALTREAVDAFRTRLDNLHRDAQNLYADALAAGVPKELARLPLTVSRYSQMRASTNLRNWLAFMTLRMDPDAQWEIRQFANAVGQIVEATFPQTWQLFNQERSNG